MIYKMTTSGSSTVKEMLLPMNQTSVTPDWGFNHIIRTVNIGSNQVFPKVASYTGNGGTYAAFHQRFWGGTRTSLTNLPRYITSNKMPGVAPVSSYNMYGAGYAWAGDIAGVSFNTVVNCAIPFSNSSDFYVAGATFNMTGNQQNYTHNVYLDPPAVQNSVVMGVCPGRWAYTTNTSSSRYVSPYALLLFVDMTNSEIDQFLNRSSGSGVDAAAGFVFFVSSDTSSTSRYDVTAAGISGDHDKRFFQGYKPVYKKLNSYTYNSHSYTVAKIAIVRQEIGATAKLISQPFLHMGITNRNYEFSSSSVRTPAQNIYVLEYGCEYALG